MKKLISIILIFSYFFLCGQIPPAPSPFPNQKADIAIHHDSLEIRYGNAVIFKALITGGAFRTGEHVEKQGGKITQLLTITSNNGDPVSVQGIFLGGPESFACESEPGDGLKIVRHSVGPSQNKKNQAVYERHGDYLFSVDNFYPKVSIVSGAGTQEDRKYEWSVRGAEITFRFRPRYYQKHRLLPNFEPTQYAVWQKPVVGWCSWFAYFDSIDETKMRLAADVVAKKLAPFGLQYLQMDDGYQRSPVGQPTSWLTPNLKFPLGLDRLSAYIQSLGLTPAIWTNVSFEDTLFAQSHKTLFVGNGLGEPARGNWIGYIMDGSNPAALSTLIEPVYKGLKKMGWGYFKLDALRHLRNEGYNTWSDYFTTKKTDRVAAFQNIVRSVRQSIGKETFLLACWGPRPELTGLIDGCRIGTDGYSYAGLAQYNSFNNVVWRNDPDHIVLSEREAYRSCTATSLSGSLFMLTDKPEKYEDTVLIEAAKRSIPVLFTQPGQVHDVDPSRSIRLEDADLETSGSGPRSFDASATTTTGLFQLDIDKTFEKWTVLGRLDERDRIIPFKDLGLDAAKDYLIFEFWSKSFEGVHTTSFTPGALQAPYHCQVFCFRERLGRPQVLATNRHISCGGPDLTDVVWSGSTLSGISDLIPNTDYAIYLYEPEGYALKYFECPDAAMVSNHQAGNLRTIIVRPTGKRSIGWKAGY